MWWFNIWFVLRMKQKKTATNTLNERKKISRAHATVDALMLESPSNYQMHNWTSLKVIYIYPSDRYEDRKSNWEPNNKNNQEKESESKRKIKKRNKKRSLRKYINVIIKHICAGGSQNTKCITIVRFTHRIRIMHVFIALWLLWTFIAFYLWFLCEVIDYMQITFGIEFQQEKNTTVHNIANRLTNKRRNSAPNKMAWNDINTNTHSGQSTAAKSNRNQDNKTETNEVNDKTPGRISAFFRNY